MDRGFDIPLVGVTIPGIAVQNTMSMVFNIPWVGGENTMGRMVKISWREGSKYHRYRVRYTIYRGVKIPRIGGPICHR
jgi:hypothetical protein